MAREVLPSGMAGREETKVLSLYVFALILGGLLLGVSLLGGHHASDMHPVQLDHGVMTGDASAASQDPSHPHPASASSLLPQLLSIRGLTYLLAFGGGTGLLLRLLGRVGEPVAVLISLAVGVISGGLAQVIFARAARMGTEGSLTERDMLGRIATVLVPFGGKEVGKVRLQVKDTTLDLPSLSDDGREMRQQDEVVILEINDGRAVVSGVTHSKKG